jgi:hypothetical protein
LSYGRSLNAPASIHDDGGLPPYTDFRYSAKSLICAGVSVTVSSGRHRVLPG